jgi:hypothetical protein
MSYNGSGTFQINTSGQPVVAGTVISATAFNALTADLATGLSTAITKDGQTTTTVRIPFAAGISSTLTTDSSSVSTGSIITAGGVGVAKNLYVGVNANVAGTLGVTGVATFSAAPIYSSLTASSAVATDASKGLVSVTNTGTGNNVLATSPTLVTPILGAASATSVTVAAGAVGTPSITTTGDTNTGIFFPAADTIAFSEGGTEVMRIDSSGNVGIGTSSPANKLVVKGTNAVINVENTGLFNFNFASSATGGEIIQDSNYPILFKTNNTERARIDSSGRLLVGCTATDSAAQFRFQYGAGQNGLQLFDNNGATGSTFAIFAINSGSPSNIGSISRVGATAAVIYNTTSDYRLKTVTGAVNGQGERIDALKPVDYQWKNGGTTARGFLAHEFQEIYPSSVTGSKDAVDSEEKPVYQAMQTSTPEVIADLVAEIQSLRKRLATLEQA